jgi:chromosome segregation ATPase
VKLKAGELAERFAEAQREINRGQERNKELQAKLDLVTEEKAQCDRRVMMISSSLFLFPLLLLLLLLLLIVPCVLRI